MPDSEVTLTALLELDVEDAAEQARAIGDAWHDLADNLEAIDDE